MLHRRNDSTLALKDYSKAIQLNPNKEEYYFFRGVILNLEGDNKAALRDLDHALRINPNYREAIAAKEKFLKI